MKCVSCGAELRPNARFCNNCGAVQPTEVAEPVTAKASVEAVEAPASEGDTSSERLKRPPRVLRASEELDYSAGQSGQQEQPAQNGNGAETLAQLAVSAPPFVVSQQPADSAEDDNSRASGSQPRLDANSISDPDEDTDGEATRPSPVVRIGGQSAPLMTPSAAWADADTQETPVVPLQSSSIMTATTATGNTKAGPEEATQASLDGLSWPLPVSLIVGGRYRIETVLSTGNDDAEGENIYRVSDLRGYERCWSCGEEYGEGTEASERFCRECGADMLAREYLMYERHLAPDGTEPEIDQANTAPEHPVVTAETVASEERTFTQSNRSYRVVPRVTEPTAFLHGARILIGAASDVGLTRAGERNEDSVGAFVLNLTHDSHMQPLALGIVADGLGGHVNGQDASRLTTRLLTEHILRKVALPLVGLPVDGVATEEGLKDILVEGAKAANVALCNANDETGADMGSTLVAALLFGSSAYIINIGDSRGYVFSEGELRRITTDHSFVEQLIASGFVAPEDRYTHPQRNQILRSLGDDLDMKVDLFEQKLKPGMRLMLCSDGLWEMVRDDESARILGDAANPQDACDRLIASANEHGGEDNISVVVIEVRD